MASKILPMASTVRMVSHSSNESWLLESKMVVRSQEFVYFLLGGFVQIARLGLIVDERDCVIDVADFQRREILAHH